MTREAHASRRIETILICVAVLGLVTALFFDTVGFAAGTATLTVASVFVLYWAGYYRGRAEGIWYVSFLQNTVAKGERTCDRQ